MAKMADGFLPTSVRLSEKFHHLDVDAIYSVPAGQSYSLKSNVSPKKDREEFWKGRPGPSSGASEECASMFKNYGPNVNDISGATEAYINYKYGIHFDRDLSKEIGAEDFTKLIIKHTPTTTYVVYEEGTMYVTYIEAPAGS